jgi:hypothetical protein
VVVNDLDVERIAVVPSKANSPLLIYPDAVLSKPIALQRLELIGRRDHQVAQIGDAIQVFELLSRPLLNLPIESLHKVTLKYSPGVPVLETTDHGNYSNVIRY